MLYQPVCLINIFLDKERKTEVSKISRSLIAMSSWHPAVCLCECIRQLQCALWQHAFFNLTSMMKTAYQTMLMFCLYHLCSKFLDSQHVFILYFIFMCYDFSLDKLTLWVCILISCCKCNFNFSSCLKFILAEKF